MAHAHDHTAQICRDHPRHYAGIGTVPLQSPTLAIQEMERCIEELGLQGVQIGSHLNGPNDVHWNLDALELFEFFEAASDLGAADVRIIGFDLADQDVDPLKRGKLYWAGELLRMMGYDL